MRQHRNSSLRVHCLFYLSLCLLEPADAFLGSHGLGMGSAAVRQQRPYRRNTATAASAATTVPRWAFFLNNPSFSSSFSSFSSTANSLQDGGPALPSPSPSSPSPIIKMSVADAIYKRKSCKRFRRYDGTDRHNNNNDRPSAARSDPAVVQMAYDALQMSLRTPSAFNTQPYKVILVHSPTQKAILARGALGPNKNRILDADSTAVFLADRQITLSFPRYRRFMAPFIKKQGVLWKNLFFITIFSSGYPLPRVLAAPLSFLVRSLFGILHFFTRAFYPLPSLASAETWASKQACMVAMTFLLLCTEQGLATIPMEGLNASSIRRALHIPSRYAIPLMISVGRPYYNNDDKSLADRLATNPRYDAVDVIYGDTFRGPMMVGGGETGTPQSSTSIVATGNDGTNLSEKEGDGEAIN
jgi:nitroreductase